MEWRREVSIISHRPCGWQRFEARKVVFSSECLKIFAAGCNIVFGIICHYEHNFDVFREKSTATIICTFG